MYENVPADVREFVRRYIHSVEQLEVLLFLREQAATAWTAEALSEKFVSTTSSVEKRLKDLESLGLAARGEGADSYRYNPKSKLLEERIGRLAEFYKKHRISLIDLIFQAPVERIRDFADAFRLKEEDEDDR